jgi:hypothetical protein
MAESVAELVHCPGIDRAMPECNCLMVAKKTRRRGGSSVNSLMRRFRRAVHEPLERRQQEAGLFRDTACDNHSVCGRYQRRSDKQKIAEAFHLGNIDGLVLAPD